MAHQSFEFMVPSTPYDVQHQKHREWVSTLDFYQDEVQLFSQEVQKVIASHPDSFPYFEHVDEYRKILHKKLDHIHEMRSGIMALDKEMGDQMDAIPGHLHEEYATRIQDFSRQFEELKQNFRRFVAHNKL